MRAAYAILGIGFLTVILAAYLLSGRFYPSSPMLILSSGAFAENASIPEKYTCDADNVNPPLVISGVPSETKSLALIMDDPDIPQAVKDSMHISVFDHWVVFNIPPQTKELSEAMKPVGTEGNNGAGKLGYTGPCPPDREHRYIFTLYALDATLPLSEGASRAEVEAAMEGHILGKAVLTGVYNRPQNRDN